MKPRLYPLIFHPVYKEKIWGGRLLAQLFNRKLPPGAIGESWDIAAHPHGTSVVANGELAGRSLTQLLDCYGPALLGKAGINPQGKFPFLFKFIDARLDLSVQVHPDDAYAVLREKEPWGKTEMWYVVRSEPGSWIIWGLRPGITKKEFAAALAAGGPALLKCFNKIKVRPGEVYPISAGLIHALGAGVVVAEIQQNSDLTYRVYDWDRLDGRGRPRDLHHLRALDVIDFSPQVLNPKYQLQRCQKYFHLQVLEGAQGEILLRDRFQLVTSLEGEARVLWAEAAMTLSKGQTCLIPAILGSYTLEAKRPVLQITLP